MPPFSRQAPFLAIPALLPALLVLGGLVAVGELALGPALVAGLVVLALAIALVLPFARDLDAATTTLHHFADGEKATPPEPASQAAADLLGSIGRMGRAMQVQSSRQLARIEALEAVFEALPEPFLLLDRQLRVRNANRAARALFSNNPVGQDLALLLRYPLLLQAAEQALRGEEPGEVPIVLPSPGERQFRALLGPLRIQDSEGSVVLALQDVTEIKRIEQMRADFVANASHELRTPLATLQGFIETLQGPAKDDVEAHERFLAIMFEQASRMSRLVADLLTLSRIELYEHSRPEGRCNIAALLQRIATGLDLAARNRKMAITLDLAPDLPEVTGRDDEISQIFQNLIDNAVKYGGPGTAVEVTARRAAPGEAPLPGPPPMVRVTVRDHGEGIAREHLPRLTERFFRVDAARSREMGGTGLGLAIVKHAVNRHRGALAIELAMGEGSCFSVFLPIVQ